MNQLIINGSLNNPRALEPQEVFSSFYFNLKIDECFELEFKI